MEKKKKDKAPAWTKLKIAFTENGSVKWNGPNKDQTHYYNYVWDSTTLRRTLVEGKKIDWRENKPFKAALKFKKMFHGARDHTHAIFQRLGSEATYVMRGEHLEECLKKGVIVHGVILGEWRFMRRGGRVSVVPIDFISTMDLTETHRQQEELSNS